MRIAETVLVAFMLLAGGAAHALDVGDLDEIEVTLNKFPGPGPVIPMTVKGKIVAPNRCHKAVVTHTGDTKSLPPIALIKISLQPPKEPCIQRIEKIEFSGGFDVPRGSSYEEAQVSSDPDSETVDVKVVQ